MSRKTRPMVCPVAATHWDNSPYGWTSGWLRRVSADEHDLTAQRDALEALGVDPQRIYVGGNRHLAFCVDPRHAQKLPRVPADSTVVGADTAMSVSQPVLARQRKLSRRRETKLSRLNEKPVAFQ